MRLRWLQPRSALPNTAASSTASIALVRPRKRRPRAEANTAPSRRRRVADIAQAGPARLHDDLHELIAARTRIAQPPFGERVQSFLEEFGGSHQLPACLFRQPGLQQV